MIEKFAMKQWIEIKEMLVGMPGEGRNDKAMKGVFRFICALLPVRGGGRRKKYSWKSFFKDLLFGIKVFGIAILLALVLRLFVFSSFKIPTPSMEPAIIPGDYILVNKLAYGARIPKNLKFMKGGEFETFRVKGFSKVKRNDVIVFNFPYTDWGKLGWDLNVYYVKRCVALPGDTAYNWNVKSFGPLYVPRQNDTVAIDSKIVKLYWNLIRYESGKELSLQNDTVYLGEERLQSYVFQQNYYFMTGDLTFDSRDSRYWGLLPEDHIVGKAAIIWQSKDMNTGKRKWERFLKTIN
jgi:signal peptidase I